MARTSRNPEHYTVGIPQFFFYPVDKEDYDRRVDGIALMRAYAGIVDSETGKVLNADDISTCLTPEEIMARAYIGNIVSASMGGEITTLDHTASVEGRKEIDKRVSLRRSLSYTLGFDEPAKENLQRYYSAAMANFPIHKTVKGKTTAHGNQTAASDFIEDEAMLIDINVTNLGTKLSLLEDLMTQQLQLKGINLSPLKIGDVDYQYASVLYFLIGNTQRIEDVEAALVPYRNKVLCAFFKYDPAAGKLKVQKWPGNAMNANSYTYTPTMFDERVMYVVEPDSENVNGIATNHKFRDASSAETGMVYHKWEFNEGSPSTYKTTVQLPSKVLPGSVNAIVRGKKFDFNSSTWMEFSETLHDFTQAPDVAQGKYPLRTGIIPQGKAGRNAAPMNFALRSRSNDIMPLAANDPTITAVNTLHIADDGTCSGMVVYNLSGEKDSAAVNFVSTVNDNDTMVPDTHYTISGVPTGATASLVKNDGVKATLMFTGTAATLAPADITVVFQDAAFENGVTAAEVANSTNIARAKFGTNDASLANVSTLKGDATHAVVTGNIVVTLSGQVSSANAAFGTLTNSNVVVSGLPGGMTYAVTKDSDTQATITFSGTPDAVTTTTLSVTFTDDAFTGETRADDVANATATVQLEFVDNDAALTFNNTLQLSATTGGALEGSVNFSLSGSVMGNQAMYTNAVTTFVQDTHYTITGVPNGLTPVLKKTSNTACQLTFTGTTADTGKAYIDIDFLDAIYADGITVSDITNGNPPAVTVELDAPVVATGEIVWDGAYKGMDDRTVSGYMTADLSGVMAEFTDAVANGGSLVLNTHFSVSGVPAGMNVRAVKSTANRVVFTIEGTAPASGGESTDPVAMPITAGFRFLEAAFKAPLLIANVTGVSKQNMRITFPVAARVETGESYFTEASGTYIDHSTGTVYISANPVFITDSGDAVGGVPLQTLSISISFAAIEGPDAIYTGAIWAKETEMLSTMRASRGKSELTGPAMVVHQNDVGVSMIHMTPKAVLRPDGTENHAKDDWMSGSFIMDSVKDGEAFIPNLTRHLRIPFGWCITYKYRRNEF